jgi:hypothetical protein
MISSSKAVMGDCGAYIGAANGRQAIKPVRRYRDFTMMNLI